MKKIAILSVLVLALTVGAAAQNLPRFELNVYGGYGLKNVNLAGDYFYNWSCLLADQHRGVFGL